MAFLDMTTPWRERLPFAKWFQKRHNPPSLAGQVPKDISDHLADDIGLTTHDLAVIRHQWPSQTVQTHYR